MVKEADTSLVADYVSIRSLPSGSPEGRRCALIMSFRQYLLANEQSAICAKSCQCSHIYIHKEDHKLAQVALIHVSY